MSDQTITKSGARRGARRPTQSIMSALSPEAKGALKEARRLAAERAASPEGQHRAAVLELQEGRTAQTARLESFGLTLTRRDGTYGGKLVRDAEAASQSDLDAGRPKSRYYVQMAEGTLTLVEAFLNAHANAEVGGDCAASNELVDVVIDYCITRLADPESFDEADLPSDAQIAKAITWYREAVRLDEQRQREQAARKANRRRNPRR